MLLINEKVKNSQLYLEVGTNFICCGKELHAACNKFHPGKTWPIRGCKIMYVCVKHGLLEDVK